MNCQCWVLPHLTNKNKAELLTYPRGTLELAEKQLGSQERKHRVDEIERCNGKIIATIKAIDEPYFGGSSAQLEITYKCNRCGSYWENGLPNIYNISELLTSYVEKL